MTDKGAAPTRRSQTASRSRSRRTPRFTEDEVVRLHYVTDDAPGIRRQRTDDGFRYFDPHGKPVTDAAELGRISKLAVPPAYTDVWICADACGHLQATGRDARGRKQYRYHAAWRRVRDATKYDRMVAFGRALPEIRRRIEADLCLPGLPVERVLAAVLRLLESTLIRVGNEEYAKQNESYGLTTLKDEHVQVSGGEIRFHFRGKSGVEHELALRDPRLAKIVKRCQDIPGHELFQYVDEAGSSRRIGSADVNEYLRSIACNDFSAKDYRTWAASVLALDALRLMQPEAAGAARRKQILAVVTAVSERLGNTPAICRKCYIHPAVFEAFEAGALKPDNGPARQGMSAAESRLMRFLEVLEREQGGLAAGQVIAESEDEIIVLRE